MRLSSFLLCVLLVLASSAWVHAKPPQILSNSAYRVVAKAQEAMSAEDYQAAFTLLDELSNSQRRLTDYDRAKIWHLKLYIFNQQEDYPQSLVAGEKALSFNALDNDTTANIYFNLMSLSSILNQPQKSVAYLQQWLDVTEDPGASGLFIAAQVYAGVENYREALSFAERGFERHVQDQTPSQSQNQQAVEPKREWYQLLASLRMREQRYTEVIPLLHAMIGLWPERADNYQQLAAAYQLTEDEKKAFAVLSIAKINNLANSAEDVERLAQLYRYHSYPYPGAEMLKTAVAEKTVSEDFDTWQSLSSAYLQARDWQQADQYLQQAALVAETGQPYLLLCQTRFQQEAWRDVQNFCTRALDRGGLDEPQNAWKLLALSHYYRDELPKAQAAFASCGELESRDGDCAQWQTNIRQLVERREQKRAQVAQEEEQQAQWRRDRAEAVEAAVDRSGR